MTRERGCRELMIEGAQRQCGADNQLEVGGNVSAQLVSLGKA